MLDGDWLLPAKGSGLNLLMPVALCEDQSAQWVSECLEDPGAPDHWDPPMEAIGTERPWRCTSILTRSFQGTECPWIHGTWCSTYIPPKCTLTFQVMHELPPLEGPGMLGRELDFKATFRASSCLVSSCLVPGLLKISDKSLLSGSQFPHF